MHSFWIIFKQAFMTKAKTKSFIITTVIVAAAFFLMANLPNIIEAFQGSEEEENVLHVMDESGGLTEALQQQLKAAGSDMQAMPTDLTEEELKEGITDGSIEAYLVLEQNEQLSARYVSESANEMNSGADIEQAVQSVQTALTAETMGLDAAEVSQLFLPAAFEREAVFESSKSQE